MTAIDAKYSDLGGASGFLGSPVTDERVCPDGVGHFRHFAHGGSIYWTPDTGAHEVHGAIRAEWSSLGWEKGFLGYPITDATITPDHRGRFNHFQGGSIYWTARTGAHEIHGLIRDEWASGGFERNPELGYPISRELPTTILSSNRYNDFENGVIEYKAGHAKAYTNSKFTFASLDAGEMLKAISRVILPILTQNPRVYVTNSPVLGHLISKPGSSRFFPKLEWSPPVSDYSFDGERVLNRRYIVSTGLGIRAAVVPDPTAQVTLWIEINHSPPSLGDPMGGTIAATMRDYAVSVHVPGITAIFKSALSIRLEFEIKLEGKRHVTYNMRNISSIGHPILSVKTMGNGDLNVYVESF